MVGVLTLNAVLLKAKPSRTDAQINVVHAKFGSGWRSLKVHKRQENGKGCSVLYLCLCHNFLRALFSIGVTSDLKAILAEKTVR